MRAIAEFRIHMKLMRDQGLTMAAISTVNTHLNEIERELEEGYVELPKDADGKVFRVGCKVKPVKRSTELVYTVHDMTYDEDGWKIYVNSDKHAIEREPSFFEVCEPPTVEDVLREMLVQAVGYSDANTTVALNAITEFAERLQLRKED